MSRRMVVAIAVMTIVLGGFVSSGWAADTINMGFYSIAPSFAPPVAAIEKMKETLEKETNGAIQMKLYPAGQLGPESAGLNAIKIGTVQTASFSSVSISTVAPEANALMMPFVLNTWEDVEKIVHGPSMAKIGQTLESKGFKLLGVGSYGFFTVLSKKGLINSLNDMKGLKIRVYPTPVLVDLYKLLGASPTPLAFPEIFTGLQQGVIEATDGTLDSSHASKQYEVAKFLTETNHLHGFHFYVANKAWFSKLAPEMQELIARRFKEYIDLELKMSREYEDQIREIYKKEGVQFKTLSDKEREDFKASTRPIHDQFRSSIGEAFMTQFYSETGYK